MRCIACPQGPEHQKIDDKANHPREQHGGQHAQPQWQCEFFNDQQRGIASQHEHRAMRQVDDAQHAEHQRKAKRE